MGTSSYAFGLKNAAPMTELITHCTSYNIFWEIKVG